MNWGDVGSHIFSGVAMLVFGGFFAFFMWLWKRSIYGEFASMKECISSLETNFKSELGEAKQLAEKNVEQAKGLAAEGLKDIKMTLQREVDTIRMGYVPKSLCDQSKEGCRDRIFDKLETLEGKIDENKEDRIKQLTELKEGRNKQFGELSDDIKAMIGRMDSHINGHNHR